MPATSGALIVVTGPPGAGKSTVSKRLAQRYDPSVLVEGDAFFGFLASGAIDPWLPASRRQNEVTTDAAAAAAGRFAAGGYSVIYDGVVGWWLLPEFLASARASWDDVPVHYAVLLPDEQTCLHRVQTRVGHGFRDLDAARHMYREFATAEHARRHVVHDVADVEDAVQHIARRVADGSLLVTA